MNKSLFLSGILVCFLGFCCVAVDQWMNLESISKQVESYSSPLFWALPVSGLVTAFALSLGINMIRTGTFSGIAIGLGVFLTFIVFTTYSLTLSVDRVVAGLEHKSTTAKKSNKSIALAQQEYDQAKKDRNLAKSNKLKACKWNPKSKVCRAAKVNLLDAENDVKRKATTLIDEGPTKVLDPTSKTLAQAFPFLSEDLIQTYQPLLLPLGLLLAQIFVFAAGFDMIGRSFGSQPANKLPFDKMEHIEQALEILSYMRANGANQKQTAEHFGIRPSKVTRRLQLVKN